MAKVVIAGAAGRMGQALIRCCQKVEKIELVGAVEHSGHDSLGKDSGAVAGGDTNNVTITDDLATALGLADVVIDFTLPSSVPQNIKTAASLKRAAVVGATGLSDTEANALHQAAGLIPVMWAPNMSLGVNLLFAMAQKAASVLGESYEVRIDDTHHVHKKDAPSGTALRLGERVADGSNLDFDSVYLHDEGGKMEQYPSGRIVIRSHREGEVVGDHTVTFDGVGESVSLSHHAKSRDAFALGALFAAHWICTQRPGIYDMQDMLGLRSL